MKITRNLCHAIRSAGLRLARACAIALMTLLLIFASHGNFFNIVVPAVLLTANAEDSEERPTSEEESRDAAPKHFRMRVALPRDRQVASHPAPAAAAPRQFQVMVPLPAPPISTHSVGAGIRILC